MVPVQAKDAARDWSTDGNGDDGLLVLTILPIVSVDTAGDDYAVTRLW